MARKASPAAAALEDYPDQYLACRDLRHNWKYPGVFFKGAYGGLQRHLTCTVCKSTGVDRYQGGVKQPRVIQYSEGYLMAGSGRLAAEEVRAEVFRRVTVYPSQEAMLAALKGGRSARAAKPKPTVIDLRDRRRVHARAS